MVAKNNLEELIDDLKSREIFSNCANLENFVNLEESEKVAYWGVDCTSDSLHVGHLLNIIQLFRLSENGFRIIFLMGGSTTTIGDPSDKLKERPFLKKEIIKKNRQTIEEQLKSISLRNTDEIIDNISIPLSCFYKDEKLKLIYKCLSLEGEKKKSKDIWRIFIEKILPNKVNHFFSFLNNEEWLSQIKFIDFISNYGKNVTVNYLLGKEKIKQRVESKNGISFSEFSYSLLQGYDFLHLYEKYGCKGQIGASDQWGNFSTGLKMIKNKFSDSKTFALSLNLMLDKDGRKISKSNSKSKIFWLSSEKTELKELFDYFNNMEDDEAISFARKFTALSENQIEHILAINEPKSLRILQRILLDTFFFLVHGTEGITWLRKKEIKMY